MFGKLAGWCRKSDGFDLGPEDAERVCGSEDRISGVRKPSKFGALMAHSGWTRSAVYIYLYRKSLSTGSLQGRTSTLAFHAMVQGHQDFTSDICIWKMIEDWSKEAGQVKDIRVSISPALLESFPNYCVFFARMSMRKHYLVLHDCYQLWSFEGKCSGSYRKGWPIQIALQRHDIRLEDN